LSGEEGHEAFVRTQGDHNDSSVAASTWVGPAGQAAAVERILNLASFFPHAMWEVVQAVPRHGCVKHNEEFAAKLTCLRDQLCAVPLLRVVCKLGSVGLLEVRHAQGMVALLSGVPTCNSSPVPASDSISGGSSSLALLGPATKQLSE
jgi:hypothetical protein